MSADRSQSSNGKNVKDPLRNKAVSAPQAALAIVHEDDLGMCHGANQAFWDLTRSGICTSGSVMVPCPWFSEIADMQARDSTLDIGVHLTLNSEMTFYRWGPLTRAGKASGLVDGDGFFWRSVSETRRHADLGAVEEELRAQIDRALASGIDVTHLDAHMGAAISPEFVRLYVRLGIDYDVPVLLTRSYAQYDPRYNLGRLDDEEPLREAAALAERHGMAIADRVLETPFERPAGAADAFYAELIKRIAPGVNYMALHFNTAGDIEAIEAENPHIRAEEYAVFSGAAFQARLRQDCELAGMRPLRDAMRARTQGRARA